MLPSGLVTFVLTDIEGSTRVLRRLGDDYPAVLEQHRALLRRAWSEAGGIEIGVEGDGSFVAFGDTGRALDACIRAQQLIGAASWPPIAPIKVRIGLHCGLAAPHNGDYVALAVHQAARIRDAAHGGQVLVSAEAASRAPDNVASRLVDLGAYRLRDFDEPQRLYQLAARGLERHFPAVRAIPAEGHNLMRPPNTFFGRDAEISQVSRLLGPTRIVTIAGPGGVGKTRLALEVGLREVGSWADGVWLVDLAAVEDSELVPDAIGLATGAPARGDERWAEVLAYLEGRECLLIVDNAEHHVERCAVLARELVHECPRVGVLVTSREPLRIANEVTMPLAPLPVGGTDEPVAVELFADRARAVRPEFHLDAGTAEAVRSICRQVDGLPLAIEIAAAQTAVLDPATILAGLGDMARLLRSRDRSLPERQRTMTALLDWSYRLLRPDEQAALRRVSVFSGSFSLEAAGAAVADGIDVNETPELIWSLVDKSLVAADLTADTTRYRCLETVRQYGRRLLEEAGETEAAAGRLATWILGRLGPANRADRRWIGEVGIELDNLHGLVPALSGPHEELAQTVACTIGRYLDATQSFRAGIDALTRYVATLPAETPERVALLTTLADLHLRVGDLSSARGVLTDAEALRDRVGPAPWDDVGVERTAGEVATRNGEVERAAEIAETALRRALSARGRGRMWNLLGIARSVTGDTAGAMAAFTEERRAHEAAGHEAFLAGAEGNIAEMALRLGDTAAAASHQGRCLELSLALGQPVMIAFSLMVAARLAGESGDWPTAARLQGKALAMISETGQRLYADDLRTSDELERAAVGELGEPGFRDAARVGSELEVADAVSTAAAVLERAARGIQTA